MIAEPGGEDERLIMLGVVRAVEQGGWPILQRVAQLSGRLDILVEFGAVAALEFVPERGIVAEPFA